MIAPESQSAKLGITSLGERKLLVAMLERAVFDYFGNQSDDQAEAAAWLFGDPEGDEIFSFGWVCSQLELDAEGVVNRLQQMSPRKGTSTQQWWAQASSLN
jgi:hypothetical protein